MPILHDHHIHTVFSGHSASDMLVGAIIDRANAVGLKRIVILEHVPEMPRYRRAVIDEQVASVPRTQIDAIADEIRHWKDGSAARVLLGAEVDANPHERDGRLLLADLSGIDVVFGSTHFLPAVPALWYEVPDLPEDQRARIYRDWMAWAMHVAANPAVDVLSHPGAEMASMGAIEAFAGPVLDDFEKLLQVCKKYETAFELNELFATKVGPTLCESYTDVIALARDLGVKLSIGSDSHQLDRIGQYAWVQSVIEALGLGPEHYFHPQRKE